MANLIAKSAPDFTASAVMPDNSINDEFTLSSLKGKYVVLFFYPLDFTFVCPTEILEFNRKLDEFKKRNTEVVGVSIDSKWTHLAWKNTPVKEGGIGKVAYPLVADLDRQIGTAYDVLDPDGKAFRGTFLIDKEGIVRHAVINDEPLGRNIEEAIRMVDALQHHEQYGEVCPAGWNKGQDAMAESPEGVQTYLSAHG